MICLPLFRMVAFNPYLSIIVPLQPSDPNGFPLLTEYLTTISSSSVVGVLTKTRLSRPSVVAQNIIISRFDSQTRYLIIISKIIPLFSSQESLSSHRQLA